MPVTGPLVSYTCFKKKADLWLLDKSLVLQLLHMAFMCMSSLLTHNLSKEILESENVQVHFDLLY